MAEQGEKSSVGFEEPIESWVEELRAASEAVEAAHPAPNQAWWRHGLPCSCWKCVEECFRSAWNSKNNGPAAGGASEIELLIREKCAAWGVGWETAQKLGAARLGVPSTQLLGSFHQLAASSSSELEVWEALRQGLFSRREKLQGSLWGLWKAVAAEAWKGEPLSPQQRKAACYRLLAEWVAGIVGEAATVRLLQEGLASGLFLASHPAWAGCSCSFAPPELEKRDVDALITSPSGEVVEKVSVKHGRHTLSSGCLRSWALSKPEPSLYAGYAGEEAPASPLGLTLLSRSQVLGEGRW